MYDALPSLPAALASCYVLVFAYAAATVLLPSAAVAAAAGSVSELERRTVAQACSANACAHANMPVGL